MDDSNATASPQKTRKRLLQGGEAATTRFGMEDGDSTDVPATGTDPERQSPESAAEGVGASTGLQRSGAVPGGGPGAGVGSLGTGGSSTGNEATGSARGAAD